MCQIHVRETKYTLTVEKILKRQNFTWIGSQRYIRNSFTNEKGRKIVRAGCNVPAGGHGRREQATKQQAESKLLRDTDKLYIELCDLHRVHDPWEQF